MEKKSLLLILLIIILIGIIGFLLTNNLTISNEITVGNTKFYLPEGYHEGNLTKSGDVNITNGYSSVFVHNYPDNNITNHVNEYMKKMRENNSTVGLENITIENNIIYKTTTNNTAEPIHYWFTKDGQSYTIYTWDTNSKMNSLIQNIMTKKTH